MSNEHVLFLDDVQTIKDHQCPYCTYAKARIIVDVETDRMPQADDEGRLQYFCLNCGKLFTIDASSMLMRA